MTSIYVGNLPYSATEDELAELFAAYGTVEAVSIVVDRVTNRPRGFGFVEMADDSQAQAAIEGLNGTEMGGRILNVNAARPRTERRGGGGGPRGPGRRPGGLRGGTSVYVGNLPYEVTEDELRDLFGAHGAVNDVSIVTDRMTGRTRGFGFVEMADAQEADAAIEALNATELGGRTLTVNLARPRSGRGGHEHRDG